MSVMLIDIHYAGECADPPRASRPPPASVPRSIRSLEVPSLTIIRNAGARRPASACDPVESVTVPVEGGPGELEEKW